MGGSQPGISGTNFERLHGLATIDFTEYHDYHANDQALPGSLASRISTSQQLNKPIIVGEAGMTTCGPFEGWQQETAASRAQKFDAKLGAFFQNGGAGYLIWAWDPRNACSFDFTTGDPLNAVLAGHAAAVRAV
jgi:hypothetical protein